MDGAPLIFVSLRKTKRQRKRGTEKEMRTTSLDGQGTYILGENESTPRNATLAKEVIFEAQKLIESGKNARFTCNNKIHQQAVEDRLKDNADGYKTRIYAGSEYDLACQVINEAKKIVAMGYNAKIGCSDAEPDKTEREKRRAYYKWKRMNRS